MSENRPLFAALALIGFGFGATVFVALVGAYVALQAGFYAGVAAILLGTVVYVAVFIRAVRRLRGWVRA